jgi:hypothetical protein
MGRRDEPELTPSDDDLAEAEAATRALLARYGEPRPAEPPAGLTGRVLAALPEQRPARRPWWALPRPAAAMALGALATLLVLVGGWALLAGGLAPADVAAGTASPFGRLTTAIATRSLASLVGVPAPVALILGLGLVAALVWWGYRRRRR